jgi:hypothetical protein
VHRTRMSSLRVAGFACAFTLTFVVAACDKKEEPAPDPAPTAPVETAVVPATEDAAAPADDGKKPGAAAAKPAAAKVDAGAAEAAADAGGVQQCCCEASGHPLESVAMSECNKERKGKCVSKERCAAGATADGGGSAAAKREAGAPQTCCCDADGKKEMVLMSECNKVRKGKCVSEKLCK